MSATRAVLVLALTLVSASCACGREVTVATGPDAPAPAPADETEATRKALVGALVADGHPEAAIHVETGAGRLDTTWLQTRVDDAYPGAGLRTAILADGLHYGTAAGGRDLAELARARGWTTSARSASPPPASDVAALVVFGWLPQTSLDGDVVPTIARADDTLVVTFGVRDAMSGDRSKVIATLPSAGSATIAVTSSEPPPPVVPTDPLAALEQALTSGDALAMMDAVRKVGAAPASQTRTTLLARAAVLPNEAIAFDALLHLGKDDPARAALVDAAKGLDASARAVLVERARQAHGEDFARKLR